MQTAHSLLNNPSQSRIHISSAQEERRGEERRDETKGGKEGKGRSAEERGKGAKGGAGTIGHGRRSEGEEDVS